MQGMLIATDIQLGIQQRNQRHVTQRHVWLCCVIDATACIMSHKSATYVGTPVRRMQRCLFLN
jgi:hypothetical protein